MRMVIVNKRSWAVGMDWSSTRLEKLSRPELLRKARKISPEFDMAAFRPRQYGFGSGGGTPEDWKRTRSLAAFVQLPTSFLGLFTLEDVQGETFWWVFAQQNGLTVGQGDAVYDTQEKAEQQIESLEDLLGNFEQSMICLTPTESRAWLEPLLHVGPAAMLRRRGCLESLETPPVSRRKPLIAAGTALALAATAWWGIGAWLEYRDREAAQASARLARMNREQRRLELTAHPERYFKQEWASVPLAEDTAVPCMQALRAQPTVVNGWLLSEASCGGRAVSVAWEHQPGADFVALPEKAVLDKRSSRRAVSRFTLASHTLPRRGQEYPHVLTQDMAARHLYQITQVTGTRLRLTFGPPEKRTIDKVEIAAPWIKGTWELTDIPSVLLEAPGLPQLLSELPGLTLDAIVFKNDVWTFRGRLYAREK